MLSFSNRWGPFERVDPPKRTDDRASDPVNPKDALQSRNRVYCTVPEPDDPFYFILHPANGPAFRSKNTRGSSRKDERLCQTIQQYIPWILFRWSHQPIRLHVRPFELNNIRVTVADLTCISCLQGITSSIKHSYRFGMSVW